MSLPNTHFGADHIASLVEGGSKKIFFAGIGGISMCSLAYISKLRGHTVSGYDRTPSKITRDLEAGGIPVFYENDINNVKEADFLVYTVAIPEDTPEYQYALAHSIPCISRADYLGYLMSGYNESIGVSGMHGKSTTTSMLERIFTVAGRDPTVSCGAVMEDTGSAHRIGSNDTFIFEACEYMDSFLDFYPTTAIILNIEMDHVDYFHSMEQIESSYAKFAAKTGEDGFAVVNCGDDNVMRAISNYKGHLVTFGVEYKNADYSAENISFDRGRGIFDIFHKGELLCHVELKVVGAHSICDALAAAAASHTSGVSPDAIARGLSSYVGARRRMEFCGKAKSGADVFSDYAHHPTEITTTLAGAGEMGYDRVVCVFQPHTYSRTKELFDGFSSALAESTSDEVVLSKIYSARETDTLGVSSQLLAESIRKTGKKATCFEDFTDVATYLKETTKEGDMILIMGAGDIPAVIELIK